MLVLIFYNFCDDREIEDLDKSISLGQTKKKFITGDYVLIQQDPGFVEASLILPK